MARSYAKLREELELEVGQNLPKSYILEADGRAPRDLVGPRNSKVMVEATRDETFFRLRAPGIGKKAQDRLYYLDTFHERFWVLHTLARSEVSDPFVNALVETPRSGLDHLWIPRGEMEGLSNGKPLRGFSLRFRTQFEDTGAEAAPIESMSMRLWGTSSSHVLETLKADQLLQHSVSLTSVGVRRGDRENFAIDDVTHHGKFTTRGTSAALHFRLLNQIEERYLSMLAAIEDRRTRFTTEEGGVRFEGEPLTIDFPIDVEDIEEFLENLLSSRKPFRLWGLSRFLETNFAKVTAIDLHSGSSLELEISPNWMRVFLREDACGNVALRLLVNLQHYLDSRTRLEVPGYGTIV